MRRFPALCVGSLLLLVPAALAVAAPEPAAVAKPVLDCTNAQVLPCPGSAEGSTIGLANNVTTYGCVGWNESGGEQVWLVVLDEPRLFTATLDTPPGGDLDLFLLSACDPAACVDYGGISLGRNLPAGTYYVVVDGLDGAACSYTLTIACADQVSVQWCELIWPPTLSVTTGEASDEVFGQAWIYNVTRLPGGAVGLVAELGYGPEGSEPWAVPEAWQWTPARFNADVGENDEFVAQLTGPAPGTFDYAYRFSYLGGPWAYGDLNSSLDGYSPSDAGRLVASAATGVSDARPLVLRLYANQPNPFNPRTTIRFDLPAAGPVRLTIYDVAGRLIRVLVDGELSAGAHDAVWDGRDVGGRVMASGGYIGKLEAEGKVETVRMGLVR